MIFMFDIGGTHVRARGTVRRGPERLLHWSEVYSRDVFPEPDWEKAGELHKAGDISIDVIRLHCMRHVMERVGQIAREALAEPPAASDR
jgi:hypothetical protein